jgi:branched-chain amino acid transport system permease protein
MSLLLQLLANGCVNGILFALLACGFGLVYRSARVFHVAFAGLFLLAPYAAYVLREWANFPLWLALVGGVLACGLGGWIMERGLYRPFHQRGSSPGAVMVASLGLFIIIENAIALGFGNEHRTFSRGLATRVRFGPVTLTSIQVMQAGIGLTVLALFVVAAVRLRTFKAIQAMGDEPELLPVLGLPLMRYRTVVFVVSGLLGGLPACLIGLDVGMDPHMGMTYLLLAAVAVLAGGIDRIVGWMAGGFLLAVLQSAVVWKLSAKWMDLVTFATLVVVLMFRPQGLFGIRRRLEEA